MSVTQVTKKIYTGLEEDKAEITPQPGDIFIATDSANIYHGEGGNWATPSGLPTKRYQGPGDFNDALEYYRAKLINDGEAGWFSFIVPDDFHELVAAYIPCLFDGGVDPQVKIIVLNTYYAKNGESYTLHSENNEGLEFDVGAESQIWLNLPIESVLTGIEAGHRVGLEVMLSDIDGILYFLTPIILYT